MAAEEDGRAVSRVQRSVIELVRALYVLAWLASVPTSVEVEHAEGDEDVFAAWRQSSGAKAS